MVGMTGIPATHALSKPNIVVFMTDDQTVEMMRFLPQTRSLLAKEGTSFTNSFVSYSLCCPSRATFLTGLYAHNHGVITNDDGYAALGSQPTVATRLQGAGYHTIHVGKYLNGYGRHNSQPAPGWDAWHGLVDERAYAMYGYSINHNGSVKTYGTVSGEEPAQLYQTDVLKRLAIKELRAAPEPFFLNLAFLAPHRENLADGQLKPERDPRPAPRHRDRYLRLRMPRDPSFNEADVSDKPPPVADRAPLSESAIAWQEARYRARARALLAVDEAVAAVMAELRRKGSLDNTLVIFTSDNGFLLGEHRAREGKFLPYEPSIRVPLIVTGPGVARDATSEMAVSNVDLAPTILQAAGAGIADLDGEPLQPYLADPTVHRSRSILLETTSPEYLAAHIQQSGLDLEDPDISRTYMGIRSGRYSYIQYVTGNFELYDLEKDPYQLENLANRLEYAPVRAWASGLLSALSQCAGDTCRLAAALEPEPQPAI